MTILKVSISTIASQSIIFMTVNLFYLSWYRTCHKFCVNNYTEILHKQKNKMMLPTTNKYSTKITCMEGTGYCRNNFKNTSLQLMK